MQVPRDEKGRPRFSVSQFRTYGATEALMDELEDPRGCPRLYRRKYVDKDVPGGVRPSYLTLGTVLHNALHVMERDSVSPEEALEVSWSPRLDLSHWLDAVQTLGSYLARGGPMSVYSTLAYEIDLSAELYVDEDFGPVMFRGILDWLGLDSSDDGLIHGVDYKNRSAPPKREQCRKDIQLKAYNWLLLQPGVWRRWMSTQPRITMHLDALKYRDVAVHFNNADMEEFHAWAIAVARKILRDEDGEPSLNDGCGVCPVNHDCPKWLGLPGTAESVALRRTGQTPAEVWAQRKALAKVQKLVNTAVKDCDTRLRQLVEQAGVLEFADQRWNVDIGWEDDVDWESLQRHLGPVFWQVISTSRAAIERATKGMDESTRAMALACISRQPAGETIKKETIK